MADPGNGGPESDSQARIYMDWTSVPCLKMAVTFTNFHSLKNLPNVNILLNKWPTVSEITPDNSLCYGIKKSSVSNTSNWT